MTKNIVTYSDLGRNGRLGNQFFQIALTISYALDTGKDFVFPEWEYRHWMLQQIPQGHPAIDVRVPVDFHYAPIPPHTDKNVDLFNGGQSSKYFAHHWDVIKRYLTLSYDYHYYILYKYKKALNGNTCSIHVRRTDYCTPEKLEYHGVMPKSYYEEAVRKIYGKDNPEDVVFVICSDDLLWCKENFTFPNMLFIEGERDIFDMFIMAKCKNNIISNSSFSWWAAYLNRNEAKKVVCPQKWFGAACTHNSKDVPVDGWIVI